MKTSAIRIRLTETERDTLDALALRLNVSRSELIRQFIRAGTHKNESTRIVKWDNETVSIIRDCNMLTAKIGININQITRKCNAGNTNITLKNEVQAMQDILATIQRTVGKCLCPT